MLLPAYNQAAGLEPIVEAWLRALTKLDQPFEFIIVNDASTDDTAAVASKLAARHPTVTVLTHDTRRGFGACLRTAIASARHPLIFYTACDYPYSPTDLTKLLAVIDRLDLASGCRTDPVPPWLRRVGAAYRLLARIIAGSHPEPRPGWYGWPAWRQHLRHRLLFGLRVWDVPSAFKLYRRSVLDRIPIQSDGAFVHAELMAKANFLGCLMAEVPIGRLAGAFRGAPEPAVQGTAKDARLVFRRPTFSPPKSAEPASPAAG